MTSQVFESFYQELKTAMVLEDDAKTREFFNNLVYKHYMEIRTQPIEAQIAPTGTKEGKKTGYGMFVGIKNAKLKETNPEWNMRLKVIAAEWKALIPADKNVWNTKAITQVPTEIATGHALPKTKKQMNGWNLFYKENKLADKKTTMTSAGVLWKLKTTEEKETYNVRAKNPQQIITPTPTIVTITPKLTITKK